MQRKQPNFYTINSTVSAHQLSDGHAAYACHCSISELSIRNTNSELITPPPPAPFYLFKLLVNKFNISGPVFSPGPVFLCTRTLTAFCSGSAGFFVAERCLKARTQKSVLIGEIRENPRFRQTRNLNED